MMEDGKNIVLAGLEGSKLKYSEPDSCCLPQLLASPERLFWQAPALQRGPILLGIGFTMSGM